MILIIGGARSGKSTLAEKTARRLGGNDVLYVATAEAHDEEMADRIHRHRLQRPDAWRTLEQSRNVASAIIENADDARVILLDCMTLLISNVVLNAESQGLLVEEEVFQEVQSIIAASHESAATWIIVSNEVGLGLVPPYPLGRIYRDALGRTNQRIAEAADHVWFLVAGLPMVLKGSAPQQL